MNLAQNVCLDDLQVDFETGSLWVKNLVSGPNQKENLINTPEFTFFM